jgi:hypothetical protein
MSTLREINLCVGELYRDADGQEMWRIKEINTGFVLREGIISDRDYLWLLDAFNCGEDYADTRQALRDRAIASSLPAHAVKI